MLFFFPGNKSHLSFAMLNGACQGWGRGEPSIVLKKKMKKINQGNNKYFRKTCKIFVVLISFFNLQNN